MENRTRPIGLKTYLLVGRNCNNSISSNLEHHETTLDVDCLLYSRFYQRSTAKTNIKSKFIMSILHSLDSIG